MEAWLRDLGAEFADVILMVDETPTKAHRAVLAARSGYFEALFRSFNPPNNTVNV